MADEPVELAEPAERLEAVEAVEVKEAAGDELREPRRTLASTRACVIVGVVAFVVQLLIIKSNGLPWPRALFSASFLGLFTGFGLWWVTKMRRRVRPEVAKPDERDPARPPPVGGWANPSKGQDVIGRFGRAFRSFLKGPRPPR